MSFYENFLRLCNKHGKTPSKVALEIGISKSIVSRWKNGGGVTDATAQKIADYFCVPVEDLLGDRQFSYDSAIMSAINAISDRKKPADQMASGLMSTKYLQLNAENRAVIDSLIEKLLKSQSDE